jgi:hypothetical protein
MADLITDGAAQHVDLSPFEPGRLPALDPAELQSALSLLPISSLHPCVTLRAMEASEAWVPSATKTAEVAKTSR